MENYLIYPAAYFEQEVVECFYPSSHILPGFPLMWPSLSHIRIRPQELSVWAGINGHGKSMITSMVALMAANAGERTVIASFEMPARKTLQRMVLQVLGQPNPAPSEIRDALQWLNDYVSIYHYVGRGDVKMMLANFKAATERQGASQFVIDSLMKCGLAEDDYSNQKFLVEDFHNAAMKLSAHVHLVAHARKAKDEGDKPGKMDIAGSAGITNIADNVYTVWRNKPKEAKRNECNRKQLPVPYELEQQPDAILECVKSREQGPDAERQYYLWYDHRTHQYLDESREPLRFMGEDEAPF